jgi:hypothetical protein
MVVLKEKSQKSSSGWIEMLPSRASPTLVLIPKIQMWSNIGAMNVSMEFLEEKGDGVIILQPAMT